MLYCGNGKAVFIETKKPGEKPTKEQLNFLAVMSQHGIYGGVAYSAEDALRLIESENP